MHVRDFVISDEPEPHKKSQTSLNSEEKPLDSETDSLGEYEDPDPSKFNEDGSFTVSYTHLTLPTILRV